MVRLSQEGRTVVRAVRILIFYIITYTAQSYTNAILQLDLLDIGIGVAEGGSPFPYTSKSGLLAQGSSSINGFIPVEADPKEPYLYLPVSTCQAIAQELPVTFQPKYGLYLWNITDPRLPQQVMPLKSEIANCESPKSDLSKY
jgi:hypothetical protein